MRNFGLHGFLLVWITLRTVSVGRAEEFYKSGDEPALVQSVFDEYGSELPRTKAPVLTKELQEIFDKLATAQVAHLPDGMTLKRQLHIIDSSIENAFVITLPFAKDKASIHAFVTTGILRKMLFLPGEKVDPEGLLRITGVLGHEMAHPIDKLDKGGIERGKRHASQAVEVRADLEGSRLVQEAGFPEESTYLGLERLFSDKKPNAGMLGEAVSSHPQHDLRLSVVRNFLTKDRYDRGLSLNTERPKFSQNVFEELKKLPSRDAFIPPASLTEALRRLEELPQYSRVRSLRNAEFSHLVNFLDEDLLRRGKSLSQEERRATAKFFGKWANNDGKIYPLELSQSAAAKHELALDKADFYRSQEFVEELKPIFENKFVHRGDNFEKSATTLVFKNWLERTNQFFPPELVPSLFEKQIRGELRSYLLEKESIWRMGFLSMRKPERISRQYQLIKMAYEDTWKTLSEDGQWAYLFRRKNLSEWMFFPEAVKYGDESIKRGILEERSQFASNPRHAKVYADFKKAVEEVWNRRGEFGAIDLLRSHGFDWDTVFKVLEIPPDQGYSQLRSAVKTYLRSPDYLRLLTWLKKNAPQQVGTDFTLRGFARSWSTGDFYRYLRGDLNPYLQSAAPEIKQMLNDEIVGGFLAGHKEFRKNQYSKRLKKALLANGAAAIDSQGIRQIHEKIVEELPSSSQSFYGDVLSREIANSALSAENKKDLLRKIFLTFYSHDEAVEGLFISPDHNGFWLGNKPAESSTFKVLVDQGVVQDGVDLFEKIKSASLGWRRTPDPRHLEKLKKLQNEVKKYENESLKGIRDENFVQTTLRISRRQIKELKEAIARDARQPFPTDQWIGLVIEFDEALKRDIQNHVAPVKDPHERFRILKKFTADFLDPAKGDYGESDSIASKALNLRGQGVNSSRFRSIKDVVAKLAGNAQPNSLEEAVSFFETLTNPGSTYGTDRYFEKSLRPFIDRSPTQERSKVYEKLLGKGRFFSADLSASLAAEVLEADVVRLSLHNGKVSESELAKFFEKLKELSPAASKTKDSFLESVAWKLKIKEPFLSKYVEASKATNWRDLNPYWVNAGSAATEALSKAKGEGRFQLLGYFMAPEHQEMPAPLLEEIKKTREDLLWKLHEGRELDETRKFVKAQSREESEQLKYYLEGALSKSTPDERIPLIEVALTAGESSISKDPGFEKTLARKYLGYAPDSLMEKMLLSFLEAVPRHERTTSLAYLLSRSGSQRGSFASLCQVFQTVGIKFCQMASIWKLFGEEFSKEGSVLKDSAEAMSKAEVEKVLSETLSPEEHAKISNLKRVLGAASLKTVVQAELKDGRDVAILVQRPNASNQIPSNLALSRKFLRELKARGVQIPGGLLANLIDSLEEQLVDETNMKAEAKLHEEARKRYSEYNVKLRKDLGAWHFEVPALVHGFSPHSNLLVMEMAKGTTLSKASPEIVKAVGRPVAAAGLESLLRDGAFNADSHTGNFMVDPTTRTIYPLDFGQTEKFTRQVPWRSDDRYVLAKFMKALGEGSADELIAAADKMRRPDRPKPLRPRVMKLKSELRKLFNDPHMKTEDRLVEVVNSLEEHGFTLSKKFNFGALKGLMILQGEGYVSPDDFMRLARSRIARTFVEKAPAVICDRVSCEVDRCGEALKDLFRYLPGP